MSITKMGEILNKLVDFQRANQDEDGHPEVGRRDTIMSSSDRATGATPSHKHQRSLAAPSVGTRDQCKPPSEGVGQERTDPLTASPRKPRMTTRHHDSVHHPD